MAKTPATGGIKLTIDPDDFDLGDMEDFANITGLEIDEAVRTVRGEDGQLRAKVPAKALVAFVYLAKRREDPNFKLEDARRVKVNELEFPSATEDPTPAADATNG